MKKLFLLCVMSILLMNVACDKKEQTNSFFEDAGKKMDQGIQKTEDKLDSGLNKSGKKIQTGLNKAGEKIIEITD
ncbi:MAG: hypothetical protein HQM16_04515 [Deltaproteobacteria bacterium]|nr:hypothetical protein [Deltaproteobacteria bacterium]